ncbi:MAG: ribosome biogenesis GTPase Der [Dehalococcoidia bacterium]|nr:ribosome biogenesis GTPase Der [Dehalococcoidia bacterium]
MAKPIVAIVGRPNVGKSTLFNRIVGHRVAIVEDIPGTTRDRLYGDAEWMGKEFTLVDTGGLEPGSPDEWAERIREQVEIAIEEADVIVFLTDARDGLTEVDREITDLLRRTTQPVLLGVNKVDNEQRRLEAVEFFALSLGEPITLSAFHGTGTGDLLDTLVSHFPAAFEEEEIGKAAKIAIVGRPNVGKSMLLNCLLGEERVIVSEVPGTTRDAIDTVLDWEGERVLLIDTAGIRRRGKIEGGVEKYSVMRSLRAIERADVVLLILDAAEAMTAQDAHIAGYAYEAYKGMVIVVNKWDLVADSGETHDDYTRHIREDIKFLPSAPILFISAKTGQGVDQILPAVMKVKHEREKRIPTAQLNTSVTEAVLGHSPPSARGRRLKVLYTTQAEVNPPTFVFFVNDPKLLHFSYQRYLENKLREAFGFDGTPIKLILKPREKGKQ